MNWHENENENEVNGECSDGKKRALHTKIHYLIELICYVGVPKSQQSEIYRNCSVHAFTRSANESELLLK